MAIRDVLKKAAAFAAACAGAIALFVSVFLFGKRTGKKESEVEVKADEAERKKESEIEKIPANVLAGNSPNAAALGRRKDELKSDFNSRADSITENFLHTRGRASSCGSAES
ncbi:MAG: hypothetical protein K5681_03720 [Treponema sp.]|nr:hypothetical protein [Treponema sp.]